MKTTKKLTYHRVLDYWQRNRKVTIHMLDADGHLSAFAVPEPHSDEYVQQMRIAIDHAEVFQIGCRRPMNREVFNEIIGLTENIAELRTCNPFCARRCTQ